MLPLDILFEDKALLVISKPAGLMVENDRYGNPSVEQSVADHFRRSGQPHAVCGIVHRLDRPVSGTLVIAKTASALRKLNEEMRMRRFRKWYFAVVEGTPENKSGMLSSWLIKDPVKKRAIVSVKGKKDALLSELHYQLIATAQEFSLLKVRLHTGRYHQIRAQLADAGHPIAGDAHYGAKTAMPAHTIALHACAIGCIHPSSGEKLYLEAARPTAGAWSGFREA